MSTRHTEEQTSSRDTFEALFVQRLEAMKKCPEHTTTLTAEVWQSIAYAVRNHFMSSIHTGAVVGAGNFFCTQCDKDIHKVIAGPLPPCSRCHGTVFRRCFSNAVGF